MATLIQFITSTASEYIQIVSELYNEYGLLGPIIYTILGIAIIAGILALLIRIVYKIAKPIVHFFEHVAFWIGEIIYYGWKTGYWIMVKAKKEPNPKTKIRMEQLKTNLNNMAERFEIRAKIQAKIDEEKLREWERDQIADRIEKNRQEEYEKSIRGDYY